MHTIIVAVAFGLGVAASLALWQTQTVPKHTFTATDITGAQWAGDFELTDHNGQRQRLADFRGKVVLVFFGYTNCPDACPTALADLARVVDDLGADSKKVQVLFVTVDPVRDSAQRLATYVKAFHPSFLGLRGTAEETARVTRDFKAYFRSDAPKDAAHTSHGPHGDAQYIVDHSTGILTFDREGRPRLFIDADQRSAPAITRDVRLLLAS